MSDSSKPAITAERRAVLHAVVARILPGIDGPGAAATDAAVGVEMALLDPYFRGLRPGLEALLDRLEAQARQAHAQAFHECAASEQDELLRALGRDPNPWIPMIFRSLIGLSLEGLLGDPVHGGNRDFKGWEALGLQPADVRSGFCRAAEAGH